VAHETIRTFLTFLRFFQNPKRHDLLRFFESLHTFSRTMFKTISNLNSSRGRDNKGVDARSSHFDGGRHLELQPDVPGMMRLNPSLSVGDLMRQYTFEMTILHHEWHCC